MPEVRGVPVPCAIIWRQSNQSVQGTFRMLKRLHYFAPLFLCLVASSLFAQLPPVTTDPLHPAGAIQGAAGCSTTEASACSHASAKNSPILVGGTTHQENM